MKQTLLILALFLLLAPKIRSQGVSDKGLLFSMGAGSAFLFGDVPVQNPSMAFIKQNLAMGVQLRKYLLEGISCGTDFYSYSCRSGADLPGRNYQFRSRIFAVSFFGAIDPISFFMDDYQDFDFVLSLHLGTLHARVPYMAFPIESGRPDGTDKLSSQSWGLSYGCGEGWRFRFSSMLGIQLEGVYNFTTTDFLDGFSPKNSQYGDRYLHVVLQLFIRLPDSLSLR